MPCTCKLPSGMGAEIMECLLIFRGTGIKIGGSGVVSDTEMNVPWFNFPVSPVEIGNAFEQPSFLCHFCKVLFLLPLMGKQFRKWYVTIPTGFGASLAIELLQLAIRS